MAAEDFADFTGAIDNATDSLGDFQEALDDAGGAAGDVGGFGDLGGEEGGKSVGAALGGLLGGGPEGEGAAMKGIASTLLSIASSGLPPGVGTVLTKAIGSKL